MQMLSRQRCDWTYVPHFFHFYSLWTQKVHIWDMGPRYRWFGVTKNSHILTLPRNLFLFLITTQKSYVGYISRNKKYNFQQFNKEIRRSKKNLIQFRYFTLHFFSLHFMPSTKSRQSQIQDHIIVVAFLSDFVIFHTKVVRWKGGIMWTFVFIRKIKLG